MKTRKLLIVFAILEYSISLNGQVGINTTSPASTLDILAKNTTGTATSVDGLLIPRVDRERAQSMSGIPVSTLIYVNNIITGAQAGVASNIDAVGYYFYNGSAWTKLNPTSSNTNENTNVYNVDGTLTENRVVNMGGNKFTFKGNSTHAFSVAGTNLSVDAANNRVGIGTAAPVSRLHVDGGESRFSNTTSAWALSPTIGGTTGSTNSFEIIDRVKNVRRMVFNDNGDVSLGGSLSDNGSAGVVSIRNGNVGIGIGRPQTKLDITTATNSYGMQHTDGTIKLRTYLGTGDTNGTTAAGWFGTNSNHPLDIMTGNVFRARFDTNGNLGIGTYSPQGTLHVVAKTPTDNRYNLFDAPEGSNDFAIVALRNTSAAAAGNKALLGFTNTGPTSGGANWGIGSIRTATDEDFFFGNSTGGGYNERMRIKANGFVGIGTNAPTAALTVIGEANKNTGTAWLTFSDSRMKKNVQPYTKGLPEILKINTVTFQYNGKGGYPDDGNIHTGIIAQEIEKVLPGTVSKIKTSDFEDQRSYNASEITYTLINAIKEQQKQIEEQRKEIRDLQREVQAQKKLKEIK